MDFDLVAKITEEYMQNEDLDSNNDNSNDLPSQPSSSNENNKATNSSNSSDTPPNTPITSQKSTSFVGSNQTEGDSSPKVTTPPQSETVDVNRRSLDKKTDIPIPKEKTNFKTLKSKIFGSRKGSFVGVLGEISKGSFASNKDITEKGEISKGSFTSTSSDQDTVDQDDVFADFAVSNIVSVADSTNSDTKNKIKFEKVTTMEPTSPSPTTPTSRNRSMRGTLFLKRDSIIQQEDVPVKQKRGELEASIESSIFTGVGMGDVKVLVAVEGILTGQTTKKKKDNVVLVIARDWCGSYIVVTLNNPRTGLSFSGTARSVVKSYSLADSFSIKVLESGNNVKFELNIDGDKEIFIMNQKSLKKFQKGLNLAFSKIHENESDEDILNMRLASVEFAESTCPSSFNPEDVQNLLSIAFDTKRISLDDLINLRTMIRKSQNRKALLQSLCLRLDNTNPNDEKEISLILDMFNESVICPVRSDGGFELKIRDKLSLLIGNMKDGETLEKTELLIDQTPLLMPILDNWQGRGKLPDVPFPPEFLDGPTIDIVFGMLFYTDTHILMDNCNMLPSEKLRYPYTTVSSLNTDCSDYQWLLDLGKNWSEHISNLEDPPENMFPNLKYDMIRATKKLKGLFNCDLGLLYDRIVDIKESKVAMLISCKYIEDRSSFNVKDYLWEERSVFEHRLYQGLGIINHFNERIERLSSTYYGPRFVENIISFSKQFQASTKPLDEGLYLCYLRWCWTPKNNIRLLVEENKRMMIPHVKLSKGLIDRQKWEWIQSIRLREKIGYPVEKDPQNQVNLETNIDQYEKFEQKFCRGMLELKSSLGIESLGSLYDLEFIPMDTTNRIFLIVYCEQVENEDVLDTWAGKYMWRSFNTFENLNSYCFVELVSSLYKANVNKFVNEYDGSTIDEIARQGSNDKQNMVLRAHKTWSPFRWSNRILHWSMKGSYSITSTCTTATPENISVSVKDAAKNVSGLNVELKSLIISLSQKYTFNDPNAWDSISDTIFKKTNRANRSIKVSSTPNIAKKTIGQTNTVKTNQVTKEYVLPCTLDNFIDIDAVLKPTSKDVCSNIVGEIIELSLMRAIDWSEQLVVFDVVEEMIGVVETLEEVKDSVTLFEEADSYIEIFREEREFYQLTYLNMFQEVTENSEQDSEFLKQAVSEAGAAYDGIIRNSVSLFHSSMENALAMLNSATSAQDTFDLVLDMEQYELSLVESEKILEKCCNNTKYLDKISHLFDEKVEIGGHLEESDINSMITTSRNEYNRLLDSMKKTMERMKISNQQPTLAQVPIIHLPTIMHTANISKQEKGFEKSSTFITVLSIEKVPFEVSINETNQWRFKPYSSKTLSNTLSFDYPWDIVEIFVNYLKAKSASSFLIDLQVQIEQGEVHLNILQKFASENDLPCIYLLCSRALEPDIYSLTVRLVRSSLNKYSLLEWSQWEMDLSFLNDCDILFDILYFIRYKVEFEASGMHCPSFSQHEDCWKQYYGEKRITMFFSNTNDFFRKFYPEEAESVSAAQEKFKQEVLSWKKNVGKFVKHINLENVHSVTDKEVKIIANCCPNLEIINLRSCRVTQNADKYLTSLCKNLKKIRK
ncbi:predicted protein [Naegleria gruberi]|uniref:Predicted protein n=1 Tax=Naegleria gruberi TaxID=5762 RepID=D2UXQ3_NAEGR|nr:uncharacterized protein NAEGRDRAFT_61205 [Naegleria gruberi]EFC50671.1 predicted protein [Naegleria gruberi]|eukprot:XP_002683415.1 predicted protein [Naegleria gruberi strain NEG-M]